jgi:tRNA pseudouridine55 synthase
MDGVLLINKPKGMTSHDVVNIVRKAYKTKKVGHAGTLDPDATGLLVLGINKGTKILQYLTASSKIYEATICFGATTDTLDNDGSIVEKAKPNNLEQYEQIVESFKGEYVQVPPMYSAVKYKGKKLYEYARSGIEINDRPQRTIQIYDIKATSSIHAEGDFAYASYIVHASKGLYVRVLSYDIGQKLGALSYNYSLKRIASGNFSLENAYSLEELKTDKTTLISLNEALSHLPVFIANESVKKKVKNGIALPLTLFSKTSLTRIVDASGTLIALYEKHPSKDLMKAKNVFLKE